MELEERGKDGECQNWEVCQNWKVLKLERVVVFKCQNLKVSEFESVRF